MNKIYKILNSIKNAGRGIAISYCNDVNFRLEVVVGLIFYGFVFYLLWPMKAVEILFLTLSYGMILITELINTSIETMLERLHPLRHGLIGTSKDIVAGAVLLSAFFAVLVIVVIILVRLDILIW